MHFGQGFGAQVNIVWCWNTMCFIATGNRSNNDNSKCKKQDLFHKRDGVNFCGVLFRGCIGFECCLRKKKYSKFLSEINNHQHPLAFVSIIVFILYSSSPKYRVKFHLYKQLVSFFVCCCVHSLYFHAQHRYRIHANR